MNIEKIYEDFKLLKNFNSPLKIKKKILKELLEATPNPWNVIGITPKALQLFKDNGFDKKSKVTKKGLPIQRAHLNNRDEWYEDLFKTNFTNEEDWYDFITKNDKTVLALSSENKNISRIKYIPINRPDLFKSTRISWTHKNEEKRFLSGLYNEIITY